MPRFTIDLSRKAMDKLAIQVRRTNETDGTKYTLQQWLTLHLKELAIADDLPAAIDQLHRETQATFQAAVRAKTNQLLQELESA